MARLLLAGNNSISGANIDDIIAVYDDGQELGKKEKEHVDSGKFKLIEVPNKTKAEFNEEMNAVHPELKESMHDQEDGTGKELKNRPRYSFKYKDGAVSHNYKLDSKNKNKKSNKTTKRKQKPKVSVSKK